MRDVVPHRLEMRNPKQPGDIVLAAGEVVVDAQHIVAAGHQPLAEMRAEKTGTAGDENALSDRAHEEIPGEGRRKPLTPILSPQGGVRGGK